MGDCGFSMYVDIRGPSSDPQVALRDQGDSPWYKPHASIDFKKKKKKNLLQYRK